MHDEPRKEKHAEHEEDIRTDSSEEHHVPEEQGAETQANAKVFPTRRCRFCWADVEPTVEMPSSNLPFFLHPQPRVTYVDPDGDLGELIKPCLCKGTRRYIHEGCLREMRAGMMRARGANWERFSLECDICRFRYRFERMWFARALSSRVNQMCLTVLILLLLTFALGFAADPIVNTYLGPYTAVSTEELLASPPVDLKVPSLQESWWARHFAKGFASVGVLSFVNVLTTIKTPWHFLSMRNTFLQGSGRAGTTGRDRVASITWLVLLVGVLTALWRIYALTHYFAARYLLNVSDRVKNVNLEDDDEDIRTVLDEPSSEHAKSE